jgi:branched-chain amino acid transport system ATP-binding protein
VLSLRRAVDQRAGDERIAEAARSGPLAAPALDAANLEVVYNDVAQVLRGVSVTVPTGSIVALLGANGAGKTTLLRAVSGLLDIHRADITKGVVRLGGTDVTRLAPAARVARGMAQVMEGRRIFSSLTVEENLRSGAIAAADGISVRDGLDRMLGLFPVLARRRRDTAGYLSGGELQMLAIGRALMSKPSLLLLDEPSLGLAPKIVEQIRDIVTMVNEDGTSVLLVEQNAAMALSIADRGYVMEHGRIVREGPADALLADRDIAEFYLGGGADDRRSYQDIKTYRRRKSWGS